MENQRDREFVLPKNIRQMGKLGETYKIYVEDFVYTYVHRTLREEQKIRILWRQCSWADIFQGQDRNTYLSTVRNK